MLTTRDEDRRLLDIAARCALRAQGLVEPNPLVGAVITRPGPGPLESRILAIGHHRRYGDLHAEADAIRAARSRSIDLRGCTMHVTLEPCAHAGKQPPCTDAILAAGISRVVIARPDPNPLAAGGAAKLRAAGVDVFFTDASANAIALTDPFVKRLHTDQPWLIAKWAQTLDGRIATRRGESKWISNDRSRRDVHHLRSRIDAIITGPGTFLADDPRLTARPYVDSNGGAGIEDPPHTPRRVAFRILIDPRLHASAQALTRFAPSVPALFSPGPRTIILTLPDAARQMPDAAHELHARSISILPCDPDPHADARINLRSALATLRRDFGVLTAMIEAGPGLLSSFIAADLVDECRVYIAPKLMHDASALPPVTGHAPTDIPSLPTWRLIDTRRFPPNDIRLFYRRPVEPQSIN